MTSAQPRRPAAFEQPTRHERLVRATQPELVRPYAFSAVLMGHSHPKRLYRRLRAAYAATDALLRGTEFQPRFSADDVLGLARNHDRAQALLAQACRLPRTHLGAKARALALDNVSLALEGVELLASEATRANALDPR